MEKVMGIIMGLAHQARLREKALKALQPPTRWDDIKLARLLVFIVFCIVLRLLE